MNVFYCITFLHYGAGRALLDLAKEAVERGHRAVITATARIDTHASQPALIEEARRAGIQVILSDDLFTRQFDRVSKSARNLHELMRTEQFDLIHSHAAVPGFAAELAAQEVYGRRLPHVSTVHAWGPGKPDWMRLQDRLLLNQVESVHAVSDDVGRFLKSEGVLPAKIERVYNGCDFSRIQRLVTEDGGATPTAGNRRRIGTVANLVERKGINYLLEAVALLPLALRSDLDVVIVGDGPERIALEEQASHLQLAGTVEFAGQQSNPYPFMAGWDLLVLPSMSEGLPVTLVEAMYLGVPVLTTDVQGNREIVDGKRGWKVAARDPEAIAQTIVEILHDSTKVLEVTERACKWVTAQFDRKACFDSMFSMYENVTNLH